MDDNQDKIQSEGKRRKIRKGTRSCWECKKRKMRCVFADVGSPSAVVAEQPVCIGCQRRGTKCISQEFEQVESKDKPEKPTLDRKGGRRTNRQDRVAKVEALLDQLITTVRQDRAPVIVEEAPETSETSITLNHGIPTPASIDSGSSRSLSLHKPSNDHGPVENESKYEQLSHALHTALPSQEVIKMICNTCGSTATLFHEMLSIPYSSLERNGLAPPESLLDIPTANSHPVSIAKYMLSMAIFLQHLHPDSLRAANDKLMSKSSLRTLTERLAETAINHVTTNDEFNGGSIEGLECVMMESSYQANSGNLRRSWIANRRAMTVAQLMNLHRGDNRAQYKVLDPTKTKVHPQYMWFRIVFHDRHLCLMLGLTQGSLDRRMATGAAFENDTPTGRLERMHCILASRILERNESSPSSDDNFILTQNLDTELQKAARSLPSKWWLMPNLDRVADDPRALFWDMGRLFNQLYHYNLLSQLHLPYMLRAAPEWRHEYSRMTCANAARDVLLRFIMFRSFNRNDFCCRTVDFFALMAAITLLLAHLGNHRVPQASSPLAHQYPSDRAMIEQAQMNMEKISRVNGDVLSAQSTNLLSKLLYIESETIDGTTSAESLSVQVPETEELLQPEEANNGVVRMEIPYFGTIRIARSGVLSRELHAPVIDMPDSKRSPEATVHASTYNDLAENGGFGTMAEASYSSVDSLPAQPSQYPSIVPDDLLHQGQGPGLTAGMDDWAFQGVDMALFDSLMKGVDDYEVE
ncbi:hypothetical protein ZTR_02902 [Talaromyces verruculosus]|nr:hypothetical protein ZTR_02902 [Talaromyces verruculosus]